MRFALTGSLALFSAVVLVPGLVAVAAVASAVALLVASYALLHAHALEPKTLGVAALIGTIVAVVLAVATLRLRGDSDADNDDGSPRPFATSLGLIVFAGLATLASAPQSPFFPYPLATILVTAAATYLVLATIVGLAHNGVTVVRAVQRWAGLGPYRAGFLTATFLILALGGALALERRIFVPPLRAAASELELARVKGPSGVLDVGPKVLCLAAGEIEPTMARVHSDAPACSFLPDADEVTRNECLEHLMSTAFGRTTESIDARYGCGADCDGIATDAALATCTKEPLPDKIEAYFIETARHGALRWVKDSRRYIGCDDLDTRPAADCSWREDEIYEERLAARRQQVRCQLKGPARAVFDLRMRGKSFREAGQALGMSETKAKNTFHNATRRIYQDLRDWRDKCEE